MTPELAARARITLVSGEFTCLADLRARLGNDPPTELRVAAGEQAKITRLRLEKLLAP
jgi:2-oxo-4-hydroxy-4-carboxy--5-ureidoimidazoline (OHCU) decarboxylase